MMNELEVTDLIDAVTHAVDEWIRRGGGTYDDLQAVIATAIRAVLEKLA